MILLLLFDFVQCMQFGYEVDKGQQICFQDYFSQNDVFDLKIRANTSNYAVKLEEAVAKRYAILYEKADLGSTIININQYCFINLEDEIVLFNVTYKTGSELADMQKVAKISDLNQMGDNMKKLNGLLDDIKRERSFLISKYDYMDKMQGSISKKQVVFGLLCLGLSFIITAITLNLIKRILQQKHNEC